MASRIRQLARHLCIGEQDHLVVNDDEANTSTAEDTTKDVTGSHGTKPVKGHKKKMFQFAREAVKIVYFDQSAADDSWGGLGGAVVLEGELLRPNTRSHTVTVFMHPSAIMNLLPMVRAMARAGLHVCTCASRFANNDSCLVMEKVVKDLGACIRHLKDSLGYTKVLLGGWSGGGSLSTFYQAQAELGVRALVHTPAGDRVDLPGAELVPADGLLIMAAHISRAKIFTEYLDPAPLDENDPTKRDVELDLWEPRNPNQPPFTAEYVARFRAAQVARNRRITAWVRARLHELDRAATDPATPGWRTGQRDHAFTVACTQADLRRVDTTLDPNGRDPTSLAELAKENHSPVGLARFTTLRSWLSQWSYDDSNADGPKSLASVSVPVLVLANGADHLVPVSHPRAMFDAVPHSDKEFYVVPEATHYYFGQTELLGEVVEHLVGYMRRKGFLEEEFVSES